MPAQTYFRTAAAELRKAIQEKQHDIDMLRKQLTDREQSIQRYIDELKSDQRQKEAMSGSSDINDNQRVDLERQAQHDLYEVTNAQQSLNQDRDVTRRSIEDIQREIRDLEQKVRDLETRN